MKLDREMAVEAMQSMGWTATREKRGKTPFWKFARPDTGGLWDVITVRQDGLSLALVANYAIKYDDAPDLAHEIAEAKERWLHARFIGIFKRSEAQP